MAIRNAKGYTFRPKGLSDALDGSDAFPGAMSVLSNIIPSNDTDGLWEPRPAAVKLSSFGGFSSPGFVSASLVVGNLEYGMVASALNSGKDQPYVYNLLTGLFLTVSGITSGNVPTSPATSGEWTPPIMALVGTRVVVTHPGFPGGAVKFGWFDISSFSATISVTTNSTTTITSATSLLQAGVQPGQTVTKADVPAGTTIVSIASNGLSAVLSAAATGSTTSNATFAGGTPAAPLWGAGDTNIANLPSVPVAVAQFNGRAYFACDGAVLWSDSLLPCNRTNANQAVTFGNGLPVTALGSLPLSSPLTGGIIQAVIAFQGVAAMQQITGDQATSNLAVNQMNVATGTLAPLSITPTNFGLAFMSPEGLRIVDYTARVSDPIGDSGRGVTVPFINAVQPSRICAAATADALRITVQNGGATGSPFEEYWLDMTRKVWTGPHTFPASLIEPWGNSFVVHPEGVPGTIFRSDAYATSTSTFTENGTALSWKMQTCLLPDNQSVSMNALIESTITMAVPAGYSLTVSALNEEYTALDTVVVSTSGTLSVWNAFNWGQANWTGNSTFLRQYIVPWSKPLVYKQAFESLIGTSVFGLKIGNSYFKFQELGYMNQWLS